MHPEMDNERKRWPFWLRGQGDLPPSLAAKGSDEPDNAHWLAEMWSGERLEHLSVTVVMASSLAALRRRAFAWLQHSRPLCFANVDFLRIGEESTGEEKFSFQKKLAVCYDVTFDMEQTERQAAQKATGWADPSKSRARTRGRKKGRQETTAKPQGGHSDEDRSERVRDAPFWYRRGWNRARPLSFYEQPEEAYANFIWWDLFVRPGPTHRKEQVWSVYSTPFFERVQTLKWIPLDEEKANLLLLRGWKPLRIWREGCVFGHLERDAH